MIMRMMRRRYTMASNLEQDMVKPATEKTGFGSFKAELADILTEDIILQLAIYLNYPPVRIDLLKKDVGRNYLMIQYMEERGQITETDITTLLRALKARKLHGIKKRVQTLFKLHTGKRCTGDDQSMQQPEDLNFGKLDLGSKGSLTSDITILGLKSFNSADQHNITLENGKLVPVSSTLEELQIKTNKGKEFTQDQVIGLLSFSKQCKRLKKLSFIDCLLPLSLLVGSLSPILKLRNIQVSWTPVEHRITFHLDSSRGKWVSNSKEATTLETKGQSSLRLLCSSIVYLKKTDSKQLQMSTILLLEIASSHNIPISELGLKWSFSGFDGKDIRLESGLSLSSLSSVEKISINSKGKGNTLSEEEVIGLINYGIKSPRFNELWLDNCKLPSSINPDIIPEESRSRNIKVISSREARLLHLSTGKWRKPDDIQTITVMCSGGSVIHRDTSESVQRSVIELLVEASNHDIPINRVTLARSFSKIDEDGNIILSSGLSLPIITSIERMDIQTEKGREMNKHEVNGILNYLQHSQRFKQLSLSQCLLPSSIPIDPSLSALKSRGVKVAWVPDNTKWNQKYLLNLDTGRWKKAGSW
ncbi:uncharacterized protein [Apostichopus japonicus]|uniref:uncharacterized protein isoform X2 n=2 Tax=Stichopus japonicus TaxID=307972 RepID=UPI003AB5F67A